MTTTHSDSSNNNDAVASAVVAATGVPDGAGIDTDLYSRQIGAYGLETMTKLVKMKIIIVGVRGLGVEIAKNLILAGPQKVTLVDDCTCEMRDMGANFYITAQDVSRKISRAAACVAKLATLNPYVAVDVHQGSLTESLLKNYSMCIVTEASRQELIEYNKICREIQKYQSIGFIAAHLFGLAASVFVDLGDEFLCRDPTGDEPRTAIIAGITMEERASITIHSDQRVPFQDGDHVLFKEVLGMNEINNLPSPVQVTRTDKYTFTVPVDSRNFSHYRKDGIVREIIMPKTVKFDCYEAKCANPLGEGEAMLVVPDFAKFGRSEQLHFATQACLLYRDSHGVLPSRDSRSSVEDCVATAKRLNEEARASGFLSVEKFEDGVLECVVRFASYQISPMASLLGGIVAQETLKFTGKYMPLHQWLYLDAFECLMTMNSSSGTDGNKILFSDDKSNSDGACVSRYADQIAIFGKSFQKLLGEQSVFLVGAGALGCEYMKVLAMMGFCVDDKKLLHVTDMDRIEVSNLNRQFLFRREHVGQAKSRTAAEAASQMNSDMHIHVMETRVGADTEETFSDEFWDGIDIVVNALDNIQSRLYVDGRCKWYLKPLVEAGTLGTKGNVQVIVPRMTESYGDSQDPPEQSIPLCTLKHFPYKIEHTIEWARDAFQGLFNDAPMELLNFISSPQGYIDKLAQEGSLSSQRERLAAVKDTLSLLKRGESIEACVDRAIRVFEDFFHHKISQLVFTFPVDHVTFEGLPFWSGPKRAPAPIQFDAADESQLDFVLSTANLLAASLGITQVRDKSKIRAMALATRLEPFKPTVTRIKVDDTDAVVEGSSDDEEALQKLVSEVTYLADSFKGGAKVCGLEFEKDDDNNLHIDFITACANLRARNYRIVEADRNKCKIIAGKIIPAIATTTAMITGMASLELLKVVTYHTRKIEHFKNAFVNLSTPLWIFSEPTPPPKMVDKDHDPVVMGPVRARPYGFTPWDKIEATIPGCTVQQLVQYLAKTFNVEVMILSVGNACLYNSFLPVHKQRLQKPLIELYETISKLTLPIGRNYVAVEASVTDIEDQVDVILPTLKLIAK